MKDIDLLRMRCCPATVSLNRLREVLTRDASCPNLKFKVTSSFLARTSLDLNLIVRPSSDMSASPQIAALRANPDFVPYSRPPTPHTHALQIGFVGLGAMGYIMAKNLATNRASHPADSPPVLVWNRTAEKAEKLQREIGEDKIRVAQSPGQVASECDVIITSMASDAVVKSIYEQYANALEVCLFVSSIRLLLIPSLRRNHQRRTRYLSRPVLYVLSPFVNFPQKSSRFRYTRHLQVSRTCYYNL